jgi:hypothetical protein
MKAHRDLLIDETRRARMQLSSAFGHDMKKLATFLRKEERKHPQRLAASRRTIRTRSKRAVPA